MSKSYLLTEAEESLIPSLAEINRRSDKIIMESPFGATIDWLPKLFSPEERKVLEKTLSLSDEYFDKGGGCEFWELHFRKPDDVSMATRALQKFTNGSKA